MHQYILGRAKTSEILASTSPRNLVFFEVLSSKNLRSWTSKNLKPQNLNLRNTDLILTSKFEEFWGFFMIDLNCFTLPSTSKKPQYIFVRFFEDPQNTSIFVGFFCHLYLGLARSYIWSISGKHQECKIALRAVGSVCAAAHPVFWLLL